jgi:hypothetical protein
MKHRIKGTVWEPISMEFLWEIEVLLEIIRIVTNLCKEYQAIRDLQILKT